MRAGLASVALVVLAALSNGCALVAGVNQFSKDECADGCDGGSDTGRKVQADATVPPTDAGTDVTIEDVFRRPSGDSGIVDLDTALPDTTIAADTSPSVDAAPPEDTSSDAPGTDAEVESGSVPESGVDAHEASAPDTGAADSGVPEAASEAGRDAGQEAGQEAGCGPTDTIDNCGSCGVMCTMTHSLGAACTGGVCTYTGCAAGFSDCNASVGADTDGCECATPSCCGTGCALSHSDGVGQTFYNCNPVPSTTENEAIDACVAYEMSTGLSQTSAAAGCTGGWSCDPGNPPYADLDVCYAPNMTVSGAYCWEYKGVNAGKATDSACPESVQGPFD